MKQILIVEDDRDLNQGLCLALDNGAYQIMQCADLTQARQAIAQHVFDLVLLDINLPDGNGLDFLQEMRLVYAVPVILLTANDTEMDVVIGLERGADDYITKPFSLAILRARVAAQLRREETAAITGKKVNIEKFVFDFEQMEFYRDGISVELSKIEQKLLRLFIENIGITLSRTKLVDRLWSDGADYVDENALSVAVKRLRDKLQAADYIKTVYGIGYVWKERKHDPC